MYPKNWSFMVIDIRQRHTVETLVCFGLTRGMYKIFRPKIGKFRQRSMYVLSFGPASTIRFRSSTDIALKTKSRNTM